MSDQTGSPALVALKIDGPNPASELAVYDHAFKLVQSGIGRIDTLLPRGLYDLEASIANQRERKSVALRTPLTVGAAEWNLKVPTAAPVSAVLPAHILHEQKAELYSRKTTMTAKAHAGDCRIFIFLRTIRRGPAGELQKPVQRFWTGFKLSAANGDEVCNFADSAVASEMANGWCALAVDLAGGGYILSGPGSGDKDLCMPVWLQPRFETQIFVPIEDGRPLFDEIALSMAPKSAGFDPARQDQTEFAAAMLAGFRRGDNPVNPALVRGLLDQKLYDPFAGIVAAHGLLRLQQAQQQKEGSLRTAQPVEALLRDIMAQLRALLGDHPDVVALELMTTPPISGRLRFPPNLRLSLDGVLVRSASDPEIIDVNAVISDVLGGLVTGRYVLWQREKDANTPLTTLLKDGLWMLLSIAPKVANLFKSDDKRIKVDIDALVTALEGWLKQQDPGSLAAQLGLPRTVIEKTIKSLLGLTPEMHRIANGSLKDIEIPASFVGMDNMALEGLNYVVKIAGAKLPALDRRVVQLILQFWEVSGAGAEGAREAALCQRRLLFLANTAFRSWDLLPPNAAERHDSRVVATILSGLAVRLYPFLLVGRDQEIIAAAGSLVAAVRERGKLLGDASGTIFGAAFGETLKKNLHGSFFSSARAEDLVPIAIRENGIVMDFMRVKENYWAALIDMTASQLANVPVTATSDRGMIDRAFVDLAGKIDQDCAGFVKLVREAIDPLTPTHRRLEELPGAVSSLSRQLRQRMESDLATARPQIA